MKERSLHKEMQIIVTKIPTYLKAMFYPHLLPSQMKIVTKILNLERQETKDLQSLTKIMGKLIFGQFHVSAIFHLLAMLRNNEHEHNDRKRRQNDA